MYYFKWTETSVQNLIAMHKKGLKYQEIAETLGCTLGAVKMKTKELRDKGSLEKRK